MYIDNGKIIKNPRVLAVIPKKHKDILFKILCDIEEETYGPDMDRLERSVSAPLTSYFHNLKTSDTPNDEPGLHVSGVGDIKFFSNDFSGSGYVFFSQGSHDHDEELRRHLRSSITKHINNFKNFKIKEEAPILERFECNLAKFVEKAGHFKASLELSAFMYTMRQQREDIRSHWQRISCPDFETYTSVNDSIIAKIDTRVISSISGFPTDTPIAAHLEASAILISDGVDLATYLGVTYDPERSECEIALWGKDDTFHEFMTIIEELEFDLVET